MFRGPINRDNSGKYVGQRVGSAGIDEDTVMLGKPKQTISERFGSFCDRCVEVILHPQQTYRNHKAFQKSIRDGGGHDKEGIQKRIRERTAFTVDTQDITQGLKSVDQKAREDQGLPVGDKQFAYEQERTRAIRLGLDNEEILEPWKHDDKYRAETDQIRKDVRAELETRQTHNESMAKAFSTQFSPEDKEIADLKAKVASLRELEQKWEDRLGSLRWYQNTEKRVHRAFADGGDFGKKMTRDEIYGQYEIAFENHRAVRQTLADKVEALGKKHDQARFPKEQMELVNKGLREFQQSLSELFKKNYEDANSTILLNALRGNPNLENDVYGGLVESRLKDLKADIEGLQGVIKSKNTNPFTISDELEKAHTALAAKRIQYGALYRMTMMSEDKKAFEERIEGYLEGKPDPDEVRMVKEAKDLETSSAALTKARTERPTLWNIFSSGDKPSRVKSKQQENSQSFPLQEKRGNEQTLFDLNFTETSKPSSPFLAIKASEETLSSQGEVPVANLLELDDNFTTPPNGNQQTAVENEQSKKDN